jgi:hypothetical protein
VRRTLQSMFGLRVVGGGYFSSLAFILGRYQR